MSQSLFSQPLNVINVGIAMFSDDLKKQHVEVTQLDWTPPGQGNMQVVQALDNIADSPLADKIAAANQQALERIIQSHPVLIGFDQAINVVPGMTAKTILHAGPPITWEKMCGAMKGAVTGALVFEGLAKDLDEAAELAASGEITFSPCHEHDCVGSMAGVTSASMFMHIVKNKTYGNIAYTNMSEQMAKILRMGANDQSVIDRLNWMRDVQGPILRDAMKIIGEIDLRLMLAQALHMGDECHNRNNAGTTLLIQALTPGIIQAGYSVEQQREVFEFVASSDYFSGPTWMAMCKAAMDAAHGIEYSPWSPPWRVTASSSACGSAACRGNGLPARRSRSSARCLPVISRKIRGWISATAPSPKPTVSADLRWRPRPRSLRWWAARWKRLSISPVRCVKSPLAKTPTSPFRCSVLWACRRQSTSPAWVAAAFCR